MLRNVADAPDLHSRREVGWVRKVSLAALLLLLLGGGLVNYLLLSQGLPVGRTRIFAPWYRGSATYPTRAESFTITVKDSPGKRGFPLFQDPVLMQLGHRHDGGTMIMSAPIVDLNSGKLTFGRLSPNVTFSRRAGFFVLTL